MPMTRAELLIDRWGKLESHRRLWEPVWQELADFIQPRKGNITLRRTPGQRQTERLFDSTAIHANELLAASMQGTLTSASVPWFGLRIKSLPLGMDPDVDFWLEDCSKRMYDALRQSNFQSESHEVYLDLGAIGTAAILEEENEPKPGQRFTGLRFMALPPGTFSIDEDMEGRVNLLFYKQEMSARAAFEEFGERVGPTIKSALEQGGDPVHLYSFLRAVYPRNDVILPRGRSKDMPWASVWLDLTDKLIVRERGVQEFPFMVPRWAKTSGETYGRGPGYTALPDIKTLNKLVELKLKALSKIVDPPVKVRDDGVIGQVRLTPGGLTHVRDMDAVQVLELGGDLKVAEFEQEKLAQSVRRIFFSDQLQLQEGPQMTAYEVQVRYELMQRILGPTLGRLEVEWLNPVVERTFWIMARRKQFLPPPPQIAQLGAQLDIEYEGPLARAQRLSESVSIQRFFQIILPLAEADQSVLDNIDTDATVRHHALAVGVPNSILRGEAEVKAIREARQQVQQQEQAQEAVAGMSQAAGKAAPMLKALIESQQQGILPAGGAQVSRPVAVG